MKRKYINLISITVFMLLMPPGNLVPKSGAIPKGDTLQIRNVAEERIEQNT